MSGTTKLNITGMATAVSCLTLPVLLWAAFVWLATPTDPAMRVNSFWPLIVVATLHFGSLILAVTSGGLYLLRTRTSELESSRVFYSLISLAITVAWPIVMLA